MRLPRYSLLLLLLIPHLFGNSLTFPNAVQQFLEHNYDLQIARQEADKSKADLTSAKRRPNPILSGSYDYWNVKHHFSDVSSSAAALATLHLDHPIELGGKRDRRIENAVENIAYSNTLLDETKREQLFTLIDAYYQVQADVANHANSVANRRDFDTLISIAQAKYDHGFLSELELEKLQLQTIDYDKEINYYTAALSTDQEALAFLLSLKSDELILPPVVVPNVFTTSLDDLIVYAQKNRADCLAAQQNIKASNASVELEKANAIPDITVGMETENYAPTYGGPLIGISAAIPLTIYDRNQGAIEKSRITALQASTQHSKILEQTASEVRQSFTLYQSQHSIYTSMLHGFESAKKLKEKQEKIFALKGTSILELLDAQKSYREYQKNLTQALIDLHSVIARLKLNSGLSLSD
ncbi:MAG: TolC family protein [Campylobacterales bacterium]|nr:TolC family protein [Campylobacterales bacterium]